MNIPRELAAPLARPAQRLALVVALTAALLTGCAGGATDTPVATGPTAQLSADEYFQQGNTLYEQGNLAAAETAFQQAATLDGQNAGYWHNLGVTQYSLDKLDQARNSFEAGLKLEPSDAQLNYLMGAVLVQLNQLGEAETFMQRANELDPALPEPYFGLGVLYKLQGQREQAIAAFETFLKIGPGQDPAAMPLAEAELQALRAGQ